VKWESVSIFAFTSQFLAVVLFDFLLLILAIFVSNTEKILKLTPVTSNLPLSTTPTSDGIPFSKG
jgi:hypothetical protein